MSAAAEVRRVTVNGLEAIERDGRVFLPKGTGLTTSKRRKTRRPGGQTVEIKSLSNPKANYGHQAVARRVVETLGNNVTASLLDVAKDRPGRWIKGTDAPSELNRAKLADLDSLVGQMLAVLTPEQAVLWLKGQDPFLQARPIDVFILEGPERLISALKAYEQGAFA